MLHNISKSHARYCAVQAIYSWELSNNNISDIDLNFFLEQNIFHTDINYFNDLYVGTAMNSKNLDKLFIPYLYRDIKYLGKIEHSILRVALFELNKFNKVPYKVIINEAIDLSKIFGSETSYKFINSILDKIISNKNCYDKKKNNFIFKFHIKNI
ncbi:MAG: transcription antitermination factor NusB [Enterobacterales bacterium]